MRKAKDVMNEFMNKLKHNEFPKETMLQDKSDKIFAPNREFIDSELDDYNNLLHSGVLDKIEEGEQ